MHKIKLCRIRLISRYVNKLIDTFLFATFAIDNHQLYVNENLIPY